MKIALCRISLVILLFGTWLTAFCWAEEGGPDEKPRVRVTISEETTRITEPLRPDGYPDYVAAVNQLCSKGVTPENNAVVLFWQAMGPGAIEEKDRQRYFQMLGVEPPPAEGDYYVDFEKYLKQTGKIPAAPLENGDPDPFGDQYNEALKRPWSQEEFPELAAWVKANEKPIALLIQATKRPRFYEPALGDDLFAVIGIYMPVISGSREAAHFFKIRAMLEIKEGKVDEAWQDLLACRRLGQLLGQSPTLVHMLVAITLNYVAGDAEKSLLQHGRLATSQIEKMRNDMDGLASFQSMAERIDVIERYFFLATITSSAQKGIDPILQAAGIEKPDACLQWMGFFCARLLDYDVILRMGNC